MFPREQILVTGGFRERRFFEQNPAMDREIDLPSAAPRTVFEPLRRAPTRMIVHLAVIGAAALPLLALVSWGTFAALYGQERKVAVAPRAEQVQVTSVVSALRATVRHPLQPPRDVFAEEAHMSRAELVNRWSDDIERASRRFGVPQSWIRAVMAAESGGRTMS